MIQLAFWEWWELDKSVYLFHPGDKSAKVDIRLSIKAV